jgi:CTP synthase (UTP-ammonia lyase)
MTRTIRIGLIGDRDASIVAHRALEPALALAALAQGCAASATWLPSDALPTDAELLRCDALWCVPGSPYRNTAAVLHAIRLAREQDKPFLGTCGGFQHAVIEYARSVLGWSDAEHAETAPAAARAVIAPLQCALVEARGRVHFVPGSRLAAAYGAAQSNEGYHCSYGLNETLRGPLTTGALRVAALDDAGNVRALELDGHRFFVLTLFQPERAALQGRAPPPVAALLAAALS